MTKLNLKDVENKVKEFDNDILKIKSEIKRIQSAKCRLSKQKYKSTYETEMTRILQEERLLIEAKLLLQPKEKTVTTYEQADVDLLDYDQTVKAIKSIQSKKTNTMYISKVPGDNDEFRNACRVEKMLQEHKSKIKPVEDSLVRKSEIVTIIDTIKNQKLSQDRIIELLERLI